jgi:hypothetical protein
MFVGLAKPWRYRAPNAVFMSWLNWDRNTTPLVVLPDYQMACPPFMPVTLYPVRTVQYLQDVAHSQPMCPKFLLILFVDQKALDHRT